MGLLCRRERELTNSCECLPIQSVASISSPKITIKYIKHINKLLLLFWLYVLSNFEEEEKKLHEEKAKLQAVLPLKQADRSQTRNDCYASQFLLNHERVLPEYKTSIIPGTLFT